MLLRADVDEHVGYIIETLNQTQMADNTIILFHADHVNAQLLLAPGLHSSKSASIDRANRATTWESALQATPLKGSPRR